MLKLQWDLIDMVLIRLNNIDIIAAFNRRYVGRRISNYRQLTYLLLDGASTNNLQRVKFLCSLEQPPHIIFDAMVNAAEYGNVDMVKYLYRVGYNHRDYEDSKTGSLFIYGIDNLINITINIAIKNKHTEIENYLVNR